MNSDLSKAEKKGEFLANLNKTIDQVSTRIDNLAKKLADQTQKVLAPGSNFSEYQKKAWKKAVVSSNRAQLGIEEQRAVQNILGNTVQGSGAARQSLEQAARQITQALKPALAQPAPQGPAHSFWGDLRSIQSLPGQNSTSGIIISAISKAGKKAFISKMMGARQSAWNSYLNARASGLISADEHAQVKSAITNALGAQGLTGKGILRNGSALNTLLSLAPYKNGAELAINRIINRVSANGIGGALEGPEAKLLEASAERWKSGFAAIAGQPIQRGGGIGRSDSGGQTIDIPKPIIPIWETDRTEDLSLRNRNGLICASMLMAISIPPSKGN